ncbi:hypothetical protein K4F52_003182 [Lecanicillium sp. MT-2017a]|nr:hypothetical protein K4F52_003182 [Lecanicillium sp. MT-2017a]
MTTNGARRRRQTDTSRILVGYWRESTETEPNQHAVYGILSRDGKLRFKVVAETRDGLHINGPLNPGDSWIVYDEVGLEPHLEGLNRLEMKEYCRVREHQQGQGETKEESAANRLKAVDLAKEIAEAAYGHERPRNLRWAREKCADERRAQRKLKKKNAGAMAAAAAAAAAANVGKMKAGGQLTPASFEAKAEQAQQRAHAPPPPPPPPEDMKQRSLPSAGEAVGQIDANAVKLPPLQNHLPPPPPPPQETKRHSLPGEAKPAKSTTQRTPLRPDPVVEKSRRAPLPSAAEPRSRLPDSISGPMKTAPDSDAASRDWHCAMQPVVGTMGPKGEVKSHGGITYKWKEGGLFSRMYVSPGSIITIDKEDYVEYRILTTP